MKLEVLKAREDQILVLANLLELYTYDFTEYCDFDIGDHGLYGYEHLPFYWTDPNRFPYLIYVENKLAGFVLVQKGSPISEETQVWDIAEFFIMKKYKRKGIGTKVAHKIWQQFNGNWQVRVLTHNQIACSFWLQAIKKFTLGMPIKTEVKIKDKNWIIYKFYSGNINDIVKLYYKVEDYFFRAISIKYLNISNYVTAYMTGVPVEDLNLVYIRSHAMALDEVISQSQRFYGIKNLQFSIIVSEELCSQQINDTLKSRGYIQTGKSVSMYTKLINHNLIEDNSIKELNANLDFWMLPLIGAFESTLKITLQYANRHKDALKNGFELYHFSLCENSKPISCITLTMHGNLSRIDDVGTLPEFQHQGHASYLLRYVLSMAKKLGVEYCFLEASDAGILTYQKLGFRPLFKNNIYFQPTNNLTN